LRDHIAQSGWTGSDDGPTTRRIEAYFLKNVQETGNREHKLVLRRHDQATLRSLIERQELPDSVSERIRDNYEFFLEEVAKVDPEDVYRGIGRLVVVDVTLDRGIDDPQLIFESLNSTGIDLSQSDLIRNFILMRLPEVEQTRLYETYWSKIENLFRDSERTFDAFVRDYLALRSRSSKQEKADEIYFAFRREFSAIGSDEGQLEPLLQELLRFARYYASFSRGIGAPGLLREPLGRLRRLVDVPAILVMSLFDCYERLDTLAVEQFADALSLIESYVFRRAVCGEQTRGYWQVFANLAYRIDPTKPLESLKVGLARQRDNYRFPDDADFRKALEERDIYGLRVCFDLLDRLENHGTLERTDTSNYSIEHVMPQNERLSHSWQQMLGNNWREIQHRWLHRLGNLTLTGYNSTYSDRSFDEKKNIPGGFQDSSVHLNRFIRESTVWTDVEMERRGKKLAFRALSIWPPLHIDKNVVEAADQEEMRALASRRDVASVNMTPTARELFEILRGKVCAINTSIIELAERSSVSYHDPDFFVEVLPRKHRIDLLLNLDYNEVEQGAGIAEDASQWKFFVNASRDGGVYARIQSTADVEKAMPMVRQAHAVARA
jgi:predicted transport protein